jgi:hypothetical protein
MHDQCFDLVYFLESRPSGNVKCPICSVGVEVKELGIDEGFVRLIKKYKLEEGCFVDSEGRDWVGKRKRREVIQID